MHLFKYCQTSQAHPDLVLGPNPTISHGFAGCALVQHLADCEDGHRIGLSCQWSSNSNTLVLKNGFSEFIPLAKASCACCTWTIRCSTRGTYASVTRNF